MCSTMKSLVYCAIVITQHCLSACLGVGVGLGSGSGSGLGLGLELEFGLGVGLGCLSACSGPP